MTAEYGMLPRATHQRTAREAPKVNKPGGHKKFSGSLDVVCAQLLIYRLWVNARLRSTVMYCKPMVEHVRPPLAVVTWALVDALRTLQLREGWDTLPLKGAVAAVSVGLGLYQAVLDLKLSRRLKL